MILFSVGAGPGALSAPAIARELSGAGYGVSVVFQGGGDRFVGPSAFAGYAKPVGEPEKAAEAVVFAPATAGTLARLGRGLQEGDAGVAYAAGTRPAVVAPDLDPATAAHPAVRGNLDLLRDAGCRVLERSGGGMVAANEVVAATLGGLSGPLSRLRVVVTTGGTREPIDSVRYVGNRSSGKMGKAIARQARRMGAEVTVVAANVEQPEPGTDWFSVETSDELREVLTNVVGDADALLMAAAVSDFKPASPVGEKIRRGDTLRVEFEATADILKGVREKNPDLFMVGFAATHGDPVPDAREKLGSKGVNLVVGNDISQAGIGFGADDNEVYVVGPNGVRSVPQAPKEKVARIVLEEMIEQMSEEKN